MLKIQYCSDLHIEFPENTSYLKNNPIKAIGDVLILAGDIVPFRIMDDFDWFFDDLSKRFKYVFWVPGNHEYYYYDININSGSFRKDIRENIFLVNNYTIELNDIRFIFSTLWTKLSEANQWKIVQRLSDFHVITSLPDDFTPSHYNKLHLESLSFIKEALLSKTKAKTTIVSTHHVPTFMNYSEKYKGDVLNEAFAVELFDLIEEYSPDYWIYGHSHFNADAFSIGKTKLLTNQLGYVKHDGHSLFSDSIINLTTE